MKSTLNIVSILALFVILASCSSSRPIMDDNVYMLKTAAIPIGDNLLDETSYTTYKYRKDNLNPTAGYYNPENQNNTQNTRNNNNSMFLRPTFFYYGMMSPMYSGFGNSGFGFGYYNGGFPYSHYNPYGYYNPYGFYNPYGYYNSNSFYGNYGNYYNPGFNNWNNNNSYTVSNNNQGFGSSGNFVSGPRATNSGYYSGVSRGGTQQLKSQVPNSSGNNYTNPGVNTYSNHQNLQTRPISDRSVSNQTNYYRNTPTVQSRGESVKYNNQQARPVQNRGNNIGSSSSSVQRSTPTNSPTRSNSTIRNSSSGSTPVQRSNGGNSTTPTRSKSTSGGGGGGVKRN